MNANAVSPILLVGGVLLVLRVLDERNRKARRSRRIQHCRDVFWFLISLCSPCAI